MEGRQKFITLMRPVVLVNHRTVCPLFAASGGLSSVWSLVGPSTFGEGDKKQNREQSQGPAQGVDGHSPGEGVGEPFVTSQTARDSPEPFTCALPEQLSNRQAKC